MRKYYRNCDELPIYNFFKIKETNDLSYLYLDFDEYNEVEVEEKMKDVWESLLEEYSNLTGDNSTIRYYDLIREIIALESRFDVVNTLLQMINIGGMSREMLISYSKALKVWKYNLNVDKPLKDEIAKLIKQLKQSKNKIRLKLEEKKEIEKSNEGESMSLVEQQVAIEDALDKNEVNLKTTTVAKWLAMIKKIKLKQEQLKKAKNGK